jgi:hypothetical protein
MEQRVSLSCSQEFSTGPYPKSDQSIHTTPPYTSKMNFNINLPSTSWSS